MKQKFQTATDDLPYWLALWFVSRIGSNVFQKIIQKVSSLKVIFDTPEILREWNFSKALQHEIAHPDWRRVEQHLRWLEESEMHHIVRYNDADYPEQLRVIADPPPILCVHGERALLNAPQIGIVGSRNPTSYGMRMGEHFTKELVKVGFTITSGFARGIDIHMHRAAIAQGGTTLAVLGTSIENTYPKEHQRFVNSIIERGAFISEFPLGTPAHAKHFPRRNRIISGLSIGVLVVEASLKSGSLITARCALEQGREIFCIPGRIDNPMTQGGHSLIKQGAFLVESVADILEVVRAQLPAYLPPVPPLEAPSLVDQNMNIPPSQQLLFNLLSHNPMPIDILVEQSKLNLTQISSELLSMELEGLIEMTPGGYVKNLSRC